MQQEFHGRSVIITGGAGAIGLALARRLLAGGAQVTLVDRDEAALAQAAQGLHATDKPALAVCCDITDADECRRAAEQVVVQYGGIDLLFNHAGLTQIGLFEANTLEVYRRVMDVNFFGSVHMTHACLPSLIARRGHIVVTSSVAGFAPLLGRSGYCAAKHALHGFFDTLRSELRPNGVGVTLVCPSFVETPFSGRGLAKDGGPLTAPRTETGRGLTATQVAEAMLRAARKRQALVLVGRPAHLAWWASRILPQWYAQQMERRFADEYRRDL